MNQGLILRIVAWSIALGLVALPVVGVLNGWFAVDHWPIRYVQVRAPFKHVSAEQIRTTASTELGGGFFALDLQKVRQVVAALPWVASVDARKQWPDTLVLDVRERMPFARWGASQLVDRDGRLFSVPGAAQLQGLPQLDGPDGSLDKVIAFYDKTQRTLSGTGLLLTGVSDDARGSWTLSVAGGATIRLGHARVEQRLHRFLDVYPKISPGHPAGFDHADLRYTNGFAVQWLAPPPPPPVSPPAPPPAKPATVSPTAKAQT